MKRIFSVLLTLVMCVSLFASLGTTASAGLLNGVEKGQMQDTSSEDNGTIYWEFTYDVLTQSATLKLSGDGYMPNATDQSWLLVQQQKQCYITELIIEDGIRSIMESAFYGEEKLESVTLPDSIEFIGDAAFADTGIESVVLPKNLQSFNGTIFNSINFKQYSVSPENPYFKSVDGVVYSKDMKKLVAFPIGRCADGEKNKFKIPESVTEISNYAFLNCSHKSFKIPGTVKNIQYQAFAGNQNLSELIIENGVKNIYDGAFLACNKLTDIHLPTSVSYIGYCSLGFLYAFDFDGLAFMLDQQGISHNEITEENALYYVSLTGFSADSFIYCTVNEDTTIYAPKGSAGYDYCNMFGVKFLSSQAIIPELLSAKAERNGVTIQWTVSSDADGYYVYRKNKSGNYMKIATIRGKDNTTYTDKEAYSSYKNRYLVKAYNANGESRYSPKSVADYYIKTPTLYSAKNQLGGIKVTWGKVSTATKYTIYRQVGDSDYWEYIGIIDKSKLYYVDKDVTNREHYTYTVRACDDVDVSAYDTKGVGTKYVASPKIAAFKNTTKGVKIEWKKVGGASSYRVYRKTEDGSWELIKKLNNQTFTYTDENVKSGVKYSYAVKAVNTGAVSGYYKQTIEYLKKPVITSATSTKTGITINYSKSTGAEKYLVYRRLSGVDDWTRIAVVKGSSTLSYKDETAGKGKTYYYTVRAYSGSYKSAYDTTGYKIKDQY